MELLIVTEDENRFSNLAKQLFLPGWSIDACKSREAIARIRNSRFKAVLIEASKSESSMVGMIRTLRAIGVMLPIVVLGTDSSEEKCSVFEAGADEYVCAPVCQYEFLARMNNLLQKTANFSTSDTIVGETTIDFRLRIVRRGEKSRQLSESESLLLSFLAANPKKAFTAAELFDRLWTEKKNSSLATIRVHINSLRKKLMAVGATYLIRTVQGRGYMVIN